MFSIAGMVHEYAGSAGARLGDGALGLKWHVAGPRVIALVSMPRLLVRFRFVGVSDAERPRHACSGLTCICSVAMANS